MGLTTRDYIKTEQNTFEPSTSDYDIEIVPFGIYHVDLNLLMGVKPTSPQLNVIQGGSGSRKTTLMLNLIVNMCLSGKLPQGHKIIVDSLENGMTLERSAMVLRTIVATRYLIYKHYTGFRAQQADEPVLDYLRQLLACELPPGSPADLISNVTFSYNNTQIPQCVLKPDFIEAYYFKKVYMTPFQREAWLIAGDALNQFPVEFFGVSEHPDYEIAEKRSTITTNIEESFERWCKLSSECNSIQIVSDYLQEYWLPSSSEHYQKQLVITPWLSRFIKEQRKTVWILSQEGITHQRDYQSKGVVLGSSGGDILKSASQNNWRVSYSGETNPYWMTLHSPVKSRRGSHPDLGLMIEPNSGAIFGKSRILER